MKTEMSLTVDKVIIVGNRGVGKTALVSALKSHPFHPFEPFGDRPMPTDGVDVSPIFLTETNVINVFDCSRDCKHDYIDASVALIAFDLSNNSWHNVFGRIEDVVAVLGNDIPIILVGTKSDIKSRLFDMDMVARGLFALRRKYKNVRYIETSAKKNVNNLKLLLLEYL